MHELPLKQFLLVLEELQKHATIFFTQKFPELGNLVPIDGSLDSIFSMEWADHRDGVKKEKTHIDFDFNRSIPRKEFFSGLITYFLLAIYCHA
jgi:hypothetical protein